jgi:hypothetical protein
MDRLEPDAVPDHVAVTFTKDRTGDIARGRFIDRSYGVLGYEWLHMLAVLRRVLPPDAVAAYLAANPQHAGLWATYDPRLFVSALTERSTIDYRGTNLHVELTSSIASPTVVLGTTPRATPGVGHWRQGVRPADDRHRHVTVHAGRTRFTVHLDPVTAPGGWQLDRNSTAITIASPPNATAPSSTTKSSSTPRCTPRSGTPRPPCSEPGPYPSRT